MWMLRLIRWLLSLFRGKPASASPGQTTSVLVAEPESGQAFLSILEQWIAQNRKEWHISRSSGCNRWNIHVTDFTDIYALCKTLPSVTDCQVNEVAGYQQLVFTLKGGMIAVLSDWKKLGSTRTAVLRIYEAGREIGRVSFL